MKKSMIFAILITCIFVAVNGNFVEINTNSATGLDLKIDNIEPVFEKVRLKDSNEYDKIILPGSADNLPGEPDLPIFGNWILVPNGSDVSISVEPGEAVFI